MACVSNVMGLARRPLVIPITATPVRETGSASVAMARATTAMYQSSFATMDRTTRTRLGTAGTGDIGGRKALNMAPASNSSMRIIKFLGLVAAVSGVYILYGVASGTAFTESLSMWHQALIGSFGALLIGLGLTAFMGRLRA